jgi:uncharacterized protein
MACGRVSYHKAQIDMKTLIAVGLVASVSLAGAAERVSHATDYPGGAWSPYLVGAGIGVLSWLTFYVSNRPIGASSLYASVAGFIVKLIAPRHLRSLRYFKENPPKIGWSFVFVLAAVLGAFIAAWTGGEIRNEALHPFWVDHFGDGIGLRALTAVAGGALMAFGARLAGGCTSGHGISGTLQLNLGSWLTAAGMFAGGIIVAKTFYSLVS